MICLIVQSLLDWILCFWSLAHQRPAFAQSDEKELWSTYVEDFNTSTLPHRKYYNLEFYEQERAAKARKKGVPVVWFPPPHDCSALKPLGPDGDAW